VSFLLLLIALVALIVVAIWLFILRQGDAEFMFLTDSRTEFKIQEITQDKAVLVSQIPFVNRGEQDGTLVDVFPRHLLPVEYFDPVTVAAKMTIASQPRKDDYWEAIIIESGKGDAAILTVTFTAKNGNIVSSLTEMVDMSMTIMPGRSASMMPLVPRMTCSTSGVSGTIVMTTSDLSATARGEPTTVPPNPASGSARLRVRL
jgi:hypothetical protein